MLTTTRPGFLDGLRPYARKRPVAAFLLGIASGFPLTLLLATMTYWLAKVGIDKKTIGFAVGLTTPYTLKFLWSPLIDKLRLPLLTRLFGQRRSWLFLVAILLFLAIIQLGLSDPANNLGRFAFWAIIVAFLSATQDIIIDAYRIEILPDEELAHGTAMNQFGYRTGNLLAGAGTVALSIPFGWAVAYGVTGALVLCGIAAGLWVGESPHQPAPGPQRLSLEAARRWLAETVVAPFRQFLVRDGAWLILLFVVIYKLGDAMGQIMLNPMIVELGFTDAEYITANKTVGFAALILGSALAPAFLNMVGMARALLLTGLFMMLTNLGFAALAVIGHDAYALGAAVGLENFATGMGLTVFATYLSGLANLAYTATQYALLSSVAAVGRTFLSAPSGYLADAIGWVGFYVATTIVALPGLLLLWLMWHKGFVTEAIRDTR